MLKTCWYVDRNEKEFSDFYRVFDELVERGLVDDISLKCLTYLQAEQSLKDEHPAIVIIHPSHSSEPAKKLCEKLLELEISERWTFSADSPDWPEELATRHYQKPVSLQLLLRELEHCVELTSQAAPPEDEQPLENRLSIIEKKLSFPVGYWNMGGYLMEDPYKPAYLNEFWCKNLSSTIDQSLANQIRTVSIKLSKSNAKLKSINKKKSQKTPVFRKQLFKNNETGKFELYNIIFSQVDDNGKKWLRVGLSPSEEKKHDNHLQNYLENMSGALAESFGITRLRLYATHKVDLPHQSEGYLLIPIASFGGGHIDNHEKKFSKWKKKEEKGLRKWLKNSFLYNHGEEDSVFKKANFELVASNATVRCPMMHWGEAENRFLKLIFDSEESSSEAPSALLVLDKRLDHAREAYRKSFDFQKLPYMKHMEVFVETAINAGAIHEQLISDTEISRMSATLKGFCGGISRRLHNRSGKALSKLNSEISEGFAKATDQHGREIDPAKKILSHFLANFPGRWVASQSKLPLLEGKMLQSIKNHPSGGNHCIENIYVAILQHTRWHLLTGHGEYICGIMGSWGSDILFEQVLQNIEAEFKEGGVAKPVVAHDFQNVVDCHDGIKSKIKNMPPEAQESITKVNSWLGIPIHLAGGAKAVFVFHAQQHYYFTKKRTQYFEQLARRTISLMNWCYFEERTKEFEHSLRHEILTPLSALPEEIKRLPQIKLLRRFIDNLGFLQRKGKFISTGNIKESFSQLEHLNEVFDDVFNWPKEFINFHCTLPQSILDQVLYIFLTNAGRYAVFDSNVDILIENHNKKCLIKIKNKTQADITNINKLFEPKYRDSRSGVDSGGGLGLYILQQLKDSYAFDAGINYIAKEKTFIAHIELEGI